MKHLPPAPGWYADPNDGESERWWSGTAWSGYVRPGDGVPLPGSSVAVLTDPTGGRPLRYAEREREVRRANPFAWVGLVLALVAGILDPLGVPGVLGVVFGAIGLRRAAVLRTAGTRFTGTVAAAFAVGLGALFTVILVVRMIGVVQGLSASR